MKSVFIWIVLLLQTSIVYAQEEEFIVPLAPAQWQADPDNFEFITHRGVPAIKGMNGSAELFLNDFIFTDGTIEYDVELIGNGFSGITFRLSDDHQEAENFYIRGFEPLKPLVRERVQYAPIMGGRSTWNITDEYQNSATLIQDEWNHVKLVISKNQMMVYVNDMKKPTLHVPDLEGSTTSGGIALRGNVIYANLVIRSGVTENLPDFAGYDPTTYDPRYLRNWLVTRPVDFPLGRDVVIDQPSMYGAEVDADLPDENTNWTPINAESRALVNLSRPHGMPQVGERRLVWLKTTITSAVAQERHLHLGFSNEIWVFVNGQTVLIEKNFFGTPSMKEPKGRVSIENTSVSLPLREGDNELLIGLANNFFGWGIIARLDRTDDLTLP